MADNLVGIEGIKHQLIVKLDPTLKQNLVSFYNEIDKDHALRNQFLKDPTSVLKTKLGTAADEIAAPSISNRLLYGLLRNEDFLQWAERYRSDLGSVKPSDVSPGSPALDKIYSEVTAAILKYADPQLAKEAFGAQAHLATPTPPAHPQFVRIWVFVFIIVAVIVQNSSPVVSRDDVARVADSLGDLLVEHSKTATA